MKQYKKEIGKLKMEHAIILEYLKTVVFAIVASAAISIGICVFAFFYARTADNSMPQYLILSIEQYIDMPNGKFVINEEGMKHLETYHLWLQIVDSTGTVIFGQNVPENLPHTYSNFQLLNYVLKSDNLENYTIYANSFEPFGDYIFLLGCDSSLVKKYSYSLDKSNNLPAKCFMVFTLTTIFVTAAVSYLFSRKVTLPIGQVVRDIENIQEGYDIEHPVDKKNKLFQNVSEQVMNLQSALKENKRLRSVWITNISHDIKTPLSTIKGYAELLSSEDYQFEPCEVIQYADQILNAEEVIEQFIEELKISQMLEEGKWTLSIENIALVSLIKECIVQSNTYIQNDQKIKFIYDAEISIQADKRLLERSLVNIICNAFIHNTKPVHVRVELQDCEESVRILICDDGKGMSKENMKHIFERYYRGTNSKQTKGTGLGLAITKDAITAHGGKIEVVSELSKGTQFTIYLPKYNTVSNCGE